MILYGGKLYPTEKQSELLERLEMRINHTLIYGRLERETVLSALDSLAERIAIGEFDTLIAAVAPDDVWKYKQAAVTAMKRENLELRLSVELPDSIIAGRTGCLIHSVRPLGTLFHIAAGNAEGLPAMSVLEGLVTGNVNILKLPSADSGLTIRILTELIKAAPELAEYLYVFDTPSSDIEAMRKMADMADGIVVWGGETAIRAVRNLAPAGVKLIEWGHRLGFAYISGYTDEKAELSALAKHIAETGQLLCSSCQTIYIDTYDTGALDVFAAKFLPLLERAAETYLHTDIGAAAQLSVKRYCGRLEASAGLSPRKGRLTFYGSNCSLTVCRDSTPELSDMYANVLVKRLPAKHILPILRRKKGELQTAGLICSPEKRDELTEMLLRSGVNRVMTAGDMSASFTGEAHDGEYPLRRYIRNTDTEIL
ncbi:MAG: acyl-CoA reductase [Ruminiclostridium sp.]|nr:acyl-CoA reductase [Ruminiclostridium sp.]